MTAEVSDDRVAACFGMALDGSGNVAQAVAGLRVLNADHQAFVRDVDEAASLQRHVPHQIHATGIAVPAVYDRGDVDVDDVAVLEGTIRRNSMAHDMVDRGAAALRIAAIVQRCRNASLTQHMFAHDVVELACGDTGHDMRNECVEDLGGKPPGPAHAFEPFGSVQLDDAIARLDAVVDSDGDIFGHAVHIGAGPEQTNGVGVSEKRIWRAALLVIGDEILSGRTQDKNVAQVAAWLNRQGIRLDEVRIVPDDEGRIAAAVNALRSDNDYLFTTGGIGPTHDDITVDSIAAAFGVPVVIHPRARQILEDYYATRGGLNDARLRMARVPEGADLIENRESGAPGVKIGNVYMMAGVPSIAARMLEALDGTLEGGRPVVSMTVGAYAPESEVADLLRATEEAHEGVAIGSYPFFKDGRYGANFVMRSDDGELVERTAEDLASRLAEAGIEPFPGGI